ncbi:MAG: hypothetical protein ACYCZ7_01770 [Minisyncoccota bacterium]
MKSTPIYPYISFGTGIRFLQDAGVTFLIHGEGHIIANIEKIIRMIDQLNLNVTKRSEPMRELIKIREDLSTSPEASGLTDEQARGIKNVIKDLRIVIQAETSGSFAFVVVQKRLDVQMLLSDIKSLMPVNVYDNLPPLAKYDFEQAGKSIAFELPTAAAFHILRGTESVFKDFYCQQVKQKRVTPLMWGNMLSSLEKRRTPPPDEILNLLRHIKDSFLNHTHHTEKKY